MGFGGCGLLESSQRRDARRRRLQALALGLLGAALAFIVLTYGLLETRGSLEAALARQALLRSTQALASTTLKLQLDEETGIRGYAATGEKTFLQPYQRALGPLDADLQELIGRLSEYGTFAEVRAAQDAQSNHASWIADVNRRLLPSRKTPRFAAMARAEKTLMDRLRADMRRIDDGLAAAIAAGAREIDASMARFATFSLVALSIAIAAVALAAWRDARAASLASEAARLGDFRAFSDAFDRMVWTAKPDGSFDFLGERWATYTGLAQTQLLGDGWKAVVHPDDLAAAERTWQLSVQTGNPMDFESRQRRADGEYRWHRHRALPLRNRRGRVTAWIGETIDVHEERARLDRLRERYETERRVSDTLQRALLAETLPSVPGLAFDAVYRPAGVEARVGGDWYDVFPLPGGRVLFSVGDVAGHGLEAAVAMNQARQVIIATALQESAPERILQRANATLRLQGTPIVTALCGIIDPQTGEGSYAAAGHPPPLVVSPEGRVETLALGGLPLTAKPDAVYRGIQFRLGDGALLIVHTDGAVEYDRDVLAGELLLRAVAGSVALEGDPYPARRLFREIFADRQPNDDVAILAIRFTPRAAANGRQDAARSGAPSAAARFLRT
jgi:PAS domain S-box-containing protein